MKTILVAGKSGLIGKTIFKQIKGYRLLGAGREDFQLSDPDFVKKYESADIIMNFTGTPIIKRWTRKNRKEILESRLYTTRKLGQILKHGLNKRRHMLGASAIGIYSDTGSHTEKSSLKGDGFMKDVVEKWEAESMKLEGEGIIISLLRFGVVLSKEGGMLKKLMPVYKAGLGGRIGTGGQAFSWIHATDMLRAIKHIIQCEGAGIYNIVSPGVTTNRDFAKLLGQSLHRPAFFALPGIALRMRYGEAANVIIKGQEVIPERLLQEGFVFRYPHLGMAIEDIVN